MTALQIITVQVLCGLGGVALYRYGLLGMLLWVPLTWPAAVLMGNA